MTLSQNQFEELEKTLKDAMRREDPPQGFDLCVMARLREKEIKRPYLVRLFGWMRMPAVRLSVTAALFLAVFGGIIGYQQYERRRKAGETARRELMLALRITGSKLQYAQERVNKSGAQRYGDTSSDSEKSQ